MATSTSYGTLGSKVAGCLLTYNHRHLLDDVLASLEEQTLDDVELIISDDCSTDGTWEFVRDWAEGRPNVRAIQTPGNLSMAGNANYAIDQTDRPYVALLHHDDVYREDLFEKWAGRLECHPNVGFVFNGYGYPDDQPPAIHPFDNVLDGREFLTDRLIRYWGCPVRGTAMIRKSCFEEVGGLREKFGSIADVDLWMRLAARYDVGYVPEPLITVRHEIPSDYPDDYKDFSWERRRTLYEIHADNWASILDTEDPLTRTAGWQWFRARVSLDRLRWLGYALYKRRPELLREASRADNPYEYEVVSQLQGLLRQRVS